MEGLPVRARKGARAYRMGRFLRRHRAAVLATALAAVILLGGGMLTVRWLGTESRLSTGDRRSSVPEANEDYERAQIVNRANWDPPRMIKLLERALEKDPGFAAARAEYGFFHLIMIDGGLSDDAAWLDKAEQQLTQAISDDPSCVRAQSHMAAVSFYRRRPGDVQKYAAAADRLSPGDQASRIWLRNPWSRSRSRTPRINAGQALSSCLLE